MRILALDGAGPTAVVACSYRGDVEPLIVASVGRGKFGYNDLLPLHVERCLAVAGWQAADVDLTACNIGPGSFTGVRVAVAFTRAFALSANRPVVAVTAFQALVAKARRSGIHGGLTVPIAAGRNEWFVQVFDFADRPEAPQVLSSLPTPPPGTTLVGSGAGDGQVLIADAEDIAYWACKAQGRGGCPIEGISLTPFYLRGADVRPDAGRSLLDRATG